MFPPAAVAVKLAGCVLPIKLATLNKSPAIKLAETVIVEPASVKLLLGK